jgi:glycosyltransferase involved in cell wall biosynthesis
MKKKVLFITNNYPAPDYRRLWKKATSLQKDGYEVRIICPSGSKKKSGTEKIEGIKIFYYHKFFLRDKIFSFILGETLDFIKVSLLTFRLYLRRGFQVIQVVNPTDTLIFIGLFYRILGYHFVYEMNESCLERFKYKRLGLEKNRHYFFSCLEKIEKLALKFADMIIVPNSKQKAGIVRLVQEEKNKIITIEPLPDLKDFYQPLPSRDYKKGFSHLALYAGSLKLERGIIKLLQAIDLVVNKLGKDDILFVLAGEGEDKEELKKYAKTKNIFRNVCFPGWLNQEKLLDYLTEADMGLIPEPVRKQKSILRDSVFEYMAAGKPVISFDSRIGRSKIGKAGALIVNYNELNFAKEIIRIIDNKEKSRAMGEIGKMKVERDLNWLKSEIKLLSAYENLFMKKSFLGTGNPIQKPVL